VLRAYSEYSELCTESWLLLAYSEYSTESWLLLAYSGRVVHRELVDSNMDLGVMVCEDRSWI
jgi:hypothetical protein